ncbi:hypothetical protein Q6D67_02095 [Haliea sp. E1-2-M8]|uniref:hypothetical protein n=1 Tax=Haliea sp. E1-2-M8 TaxID=3064706 RepID=UPI0027267B75|nr:hypothetical protein [Haliea sp. E1-2-M8]MDO8860477.1 hypothetical protein [Haliea sp. E1-2-M8]
MKPWLAILIFAPLTSAANDLVNERLSASAAAREAHWGIDCSATLVALRSASAHNAEIEDTLTKCRFIHQPPGAAEVENCPDFRAILSAYRANNAETLQHVLQSSQHCPGTQPENERDHD